MCVAKHLTLSIGSDAVDSTEILEDSQENAALGKWQELSSTDNDTGREVAVTTEDISEYFEGKAGKF